MEQTSAPTEPAIERRMAELGRGLARSLDVVVGQILDRPAVLRPNQLDRATGLGKNVAYRIIKAVQCEDPLAVLHVLPGLAPLRRLLRAAEKHAVAPHIIADAARAIDEFERFIQIEAGDREALNLIVSGWLRGVRQKDQLAARQSVFRGMSHVKGISADLQVDTAIVQPSPDGEHLEGASVTLVRGFRRWCRGVPLRFDSWRVTTPTEASRSLALDGQPIKQLGDCIVSEFSTVSATQLDVRQVADAEFYLLRSDTLGVRSAADVVFAALTHCCFERYQEPGNTRKSTILSRIFVPTRLLVFDALLHEDAYPTAEPLLRLHETGTEVTTDVNDPMNELSRLPLNEPLSTMGTGVDGLRIHEAPQYVALLRHTFDRLGWDPHAFRAYRCRIEFPLYATLASMSFDRPPRPETPGA